MNQPEKIALRRFGLLIAMAMLVTPACGFAEVLDFRIVYVAGPATNDILAGDYDKVIGILERRTDSENDYIDSGDLATLCALYIVTGKMVSARSTCDAAVETGFGAAAHNNRGVFRVHDGDSSGAMNDFERARVPKEAPPAYIESLLRGDARLIAGGNHAMATRLVERQQYSESALADAYGGARVEEIHQ